MDLNKQELLAKLDESLKDMHPSNMPFKTVTIKAIEALCEAEKKKEYKIMIEKKDERFFNGYEAWDIIAMFNSIFSEVLGLDLGVIYGADADGDYIIVKIPS